MAGRNQLYVYWINGSYVVKPPTIAVTAGEKLSIRNYLEEEEVRVRLDPGLGTSPQEFIIAANSSRAVRIPRSGSTNPEGVFGDNIFEILSRRGAVVTTARGNSDPVIIVDP